MDIFGTADFRAGLAAGAVGAVCVLVAAAVVRRWRPRALPIAGAGVAFTGASFVAVALRHDVPAPVPVAVAGVGSAVWLLARRHAPPWLGVFAAVPFAALLAFACDLATPAWFRLVVFGTVCLGVPLIASFEATWGTGAPVGGLLALSVLGIAFAVPDTEEIASLAGTAIVIAVAAWPFVPVRIGAGGAAAALAWTTWVAAFDARGRPAALLGAVGCFGLLVGLALVDPIARRVLRAHPWSVWTAIVLTAVHAVVVALMSRVAGTEASVGRAAMVVLVVAVPALVVGLPLAARRPPRERVASDSGSRLRVDVER
ncbi:MAG TPA: hypothetical protein VFX21_07875 [Acidimicrobiia bacterium]|nr:hypothetical protein [Acidimicrobiia bacterium]